MRLTDTLLRWATGPYGPGCGEPSWRCKKCEAWTDDPPYTLDACPECGYRGKVIITLTGIDDPRDPKHVPGEPLHLFVNGTPAPYREFTAEELDLIASRRTAAERLHATHGDSPGMIWKSAHICQRFVFLLNGINPGDDITYTNLGPGIDELWVRFPYANSTRVGNMRLTNLRS